MTFQPEHYLAQFLQTTLDGAFLTDDKGTILLVNTSACELFEYDEEQLIGKNIKILTPEPIRKHHDRFLAKFNPEKGVAHVLGSDKLLKAVKSTGEKFPVEVGISHFDQDGKRYLVGLVRDQSERQKALEQITLLATTDELTKLQNRKCFLHRVDEVPALSLALLDISGFKAINRQFGPTFADEILKRFAERMRAFPDSRRFCGRLTGDRFALGLPDLMDLEEMSAALRNLFSTPFFIAGQDVHLSVCMGLAHRDPNDPCGIDILSKAETAMEEAKKDRHKGWEIFDKKMLEQKERHIRMAEEIPVALERGEFSLVFQPKVDALDHRIVGAEVLIRWPNSVFGFVSPGEFIPVAEQSGQVSLLDGWVFKETVAYLNDLKKRGVDDLELAVNLSALNLHDPRLDAKMKNVFKNHAIDPGRVQFELTETALSDDIDKTINMLHRIRNMGSPIAVDDFGTGYSSLSYLTDLPLNYLKVDQSFVSKIPEDDKSTTVARSIISMAKALGLKTIVEGVETQSQAKILAGEKADILQGYHFSKPLPQAEFEAYLKQ